MAANGRLVSAVCGMVAILLATAAPARAQVVKTTSYQLANGERVLRHESEVAAGIADVWRTLTTADGVRSFLAPVVALDFRVGGQLETSYSAAAHIGDAGNIVSVVVTYLPMEMFVTRVVQTPPTFQYPEVAKRVWTVYQLQQLSDSRTRVTVSMVGWQSGPEWDAVYRFFDRGNAYTMAELHRRFVDGPKRW